MALPLSVRWPTTMPDHGVVWVGVEILGILWFSGLFSQKLEVLLIFQQLGAHLKYRATALNMSIPLGTISHIDGAATPLKMTPDASLGPINSSSCSSSIGTSSHFLHGWIPKHRHVFFRENCYHRPFLIYFFPHVLPPSPILSPSFPMFFLRISLQPPSIRSVAPVAPDPPRDHHRARHLGDAQRPLRPRLGSVVEVHPL